MLNKKYCLPWRKIILGIFGKNPMTYKIISHHDKQYFLFKIFLLSLQKTLEMKELAPNKQTLKISTHNSQKQKS